MKRFCFFILLPFVTLVGIVYCLSVVYAQSPEPHALLEKAIEAHGGAKNIAKPRIGTLKGKTEGNGSEITQEETFDLPKRWMRVTAATLEGKRSVTFDLRIDEKRWRWDAGMEPQEMPNDENIQPYFAALLVLLDLRHENTKLSPLKKTKVNGETAVGFSAAWNGGGADYYFDEKTGLLAQSRFTFQFEAGKDVETKTLYSEYKEDDGVQLARRRTTYIKRTEFETFILMTDYVITEVKILDAIPNEVFQLPGKK